MAVVFYASAVLLLWIFFYLVISFTVLCTPYSIPQCRICLFEFMKRKVMECAFTTEPPSPLNPPMLLIDFLSLFFVCVFFPSVECFSQITGTKSSDLLHPNWLCLSLTLPFGPARHAALTERACIFRVCALNLNHLLLKFCFCHLAKRAHLFLFNFSLFF